LFVWLVTASDKSVEELFMVCLNFDIWGVWQPSKKWYQLTAAGGDAAAALAGQLMRFRLNVKKVDALAWEYAVAR
jgi:hypothetical protein